MINSTLNMVESSALEYVYRRINFYEEHPEKLRDISETPSLTLTMTGIQSNVQIANAPGSIPLLDFRMYKARDYDKTGISRYFALVCASEREDSASEAYIIQYINKNTLINEFSVAKLDDAPDGNGSSTPGVTVVYTLQNATILHSVSGGDFTGLVATASYDKTIYNHRVLGTTQTYYDSISGTGW